MARATPVEEDVLTEQPVVQESEIGHWPPGDSGLGGGDDRGPRRRRGGVPQRAYITGLTMGLAGILMFFMALVSAFIVRKGLSTDWRGFVLPQILWLDTAILIASSVTLEAARRRLKRSDLAGYRHWWFVTTTLGVFFLAGQLIAWRQLARQGLYLATNPSSSFFYVLTAAHGVHLLGGIVALAVIGFRNWRKARITQSTATEMAAIYWHFLDGLWIFLFLLLMLGQ